jgi:hypothetical protein
LKKEWPAWAIFLTYAALTLALRAHSLGNPVLDVDEQFYLLVGERMRDGAIPFVDIWDRKPVGLFVLYEMFAATGQGVLACHVAAVLAVSLTATVIDRIARLVASRAGAWLAGASYPLYLSAFYCFGGQTPVFYNLPVALAALILARKAAAREETPPRLFASGAAAMALFGIALQLKYTVVFEGMAFGLWLMWGWHRQGRSWPSTLGAACAWAAIAIAPTLLALGWYCYIGHVPALMESNFTSNFGRNFTWEAWLLGAFKALVLLGGFLLAGLWTLWRWRGEGSQRRRLAALLVLWLEAAFGGFLATGTYFSHYRAPLLLPLAPLAAGSMGIAGWRLVMTLAVLLPGTYLGIVRTARQDGERGTRVEATTAAAKIRPLLRKGCLFVYQGDSALYRLTDACFVSRYVFPPHLSQSTDVAVLGVDPASEMRRILARKPAVIVVSADEPGVAVTWQVLRDGLARDYRRQAVFRVGSFRYILYARSDSGGLQLRSAAQTS